MLAGACVEEAALRWAQRWTGSRCACGTGDSSNWVGSDCGKLGTLQ